MTRVIQLSPGTKNCCYRYILQILQISTPSAPKYLHDLEDDLMIMMMMMMMIVMMIMIMMMLMMTMMIVMMIIIVDLMM